MNELHPPPGVSERKVTQMTKKEMFLQAMMQCPTVSEAAKMAKIARSTAYRYMDDQEFKNQLAKAKAEVLTGTATYLQQNLAVCGKELMNMINDPSTPKAVKVQAINTVFCNAKALTETADIMQKLTEIEIKMNEQE